MKCFKVDSGGKSYIYSRRWYSRLLRSQKVRFGPGSLGRGKSGEEESSGRGGVKHTRRGGSTVCSHCLLLLSI